MRLLKTHSHASERQDNEAGKVRQTKMKGRPSLKGQEEIVNEGHRHVTRNGRGGEKDAWKSEQVNKKTRRKIIRKTPKTT